jgi:hypothetical protein
MNINTARSELHSPPKVKFASLLYELLAVAVFSIVLVQFISN